MARAGRTLETALELDPDHPLTQTALGTVRLYRDWDWEGAAQAFDRAIELDPGNKWAHMVYSELRSITGELEEAVVHAEQLRALDPAATNPSFLDLGRIYELLGEEERAVAAWEAQIELSPHYYDAHRHMGNYLCRTGGVAEGVVELERAIALSPDDPLVLADLGHCFGTSGRREDAQRVLRELDARAAEAYVSPMAQALVYTGIGEREAALRMLERAYELRSMLVLTIGVDPRYDPLRADARFADLVRRIGLPQAQARATARATSRGRRASRPT